MNDCTEKYNGFYKNVDPNTDCISQLHFYQAETEILVNAWGRCHPEDCEWGPASLFLLDYSDDPEAKTQAFASWGMSHCHFKLTDRGISCSHFSLHNNTKKSGYRIDLEFIPGKTTKFLSDDPLFEYQAMWDGTDPGWKLVRFKNPVYVVEFHFDDSGPSELEFQTLKEYRDNPFESEEAWWKAMRGCTGTGLPKPISKDRLKGLHALQISRHLDLTIRTISEDDYLYVSPDGNYGTWRVSAHDHRAVVNRMLECNVEVEIRLEP